jgi:tripartite-type tricarboxylate transporter receptor subunit TctC
MHAHRRDRFASALDRSCRQMDLRRRRPQEHWRFRMKTPAALVLALVLAIASLGLAQGDAVERFPERLNTVVVPWGAGGRTDLAVRVWAPYLEQELGVPVVVANNPGGGGVVGARSVARAGADGHTQGVFSISLILAQWTKIPPFELDAYIPVALPYSSPFVLAVRTDSPYETLQDFIDMHQDERVRFGNSGTGTSVHIAAAAFANEAGLNAQYVPYEGDAGAVSALLRGEVQAAMVPMISVVQQIDAGELRALGVSLTRPDGYHEGVPTFVEQGVDFVLGDMGSGIYVPQGTPAGIVEKLEAAYAATFERQEVIDGLGNLAIGIDFLGADDFQALLETWNPILEELTIELDLDLR